MPLHWCLCGCSGSCMVKEAVMSVAAIVVAVAVAAVAVALALSD